MNKHTIFICSISNPKTGNHEIAGVSDRVEQVEEFMSKDDNSCRNVEVFVLNSFEELPDLGMQIMIEELNDHRRN